MRLNLDTHIAETSLMHCWQPQQKLIGLGALVFAFASVHDLRLVPVMLLVTGLLYAASGLSITFLLSRLRYPGFFLLGIVLLLPFLSGHTIIWQWGVLTLRQEGSWAVVLIAARFFSIFTLGLILLSTTPFSHLIKAMRSLGLSPILADMTLLSYRYLYDIADNLAAMQTAMRLRGFSQLNQGRFLLPNGQILNQLAALAGTLLIRSYEQSEQVYKAMRLRGYGRAGVSEREMGRWGDRRIGMQGKAGSAKWKMSFSRSTVALLLTLLTAIGFVIAEILL